MNISLIILILFIASIAFIISLYNSLATLKVKIQEAWSHIDVQLKRRADLIPNLVETVQGYATHEKEVFENVTKARASLMNASTPAQAEEANNMLTGALKSLFAIAEAYPELKAQEGFVNLQKELSDTEDKVAYARQFYNTIVRQFNETVVSFPSNIFANLLGFKQEQFFQANEGERAPVKVDFKAAQK